jgi:hypothetical protein
MQPHDMKGRKPGDDNPDPSGSGQTRLLLLVIAILGGALASQILWRIL